MKEVFGDKEMSMLTVKVNARQYIADFRIESNFAKIVQLS